jgi:hypothetical protein
MKTVADLQIYIDKRRALATIGSERFPKNGEDLYFEPNIPASKLTRAESSMHVPDSEKIAGLIDATIFGSADEGMIFGSSGIFYRTSWTRSDGPPDAFIPYWEFSSRKIEKTGHSEVSLDRGQYFVTAGSSVSANHLEYILNKVKEAVNEKLARVNRTSSG